VLDASTVIPRPASAGQRPDGPAVTLAELSTGPLLADDPDVEPARQAHHQQAEADLDQLLFDVAAALAFGAVAALAPSLRSKDVRPGGVGQRQVISLTGRPTSAALRARGPSRVHTAVSSCCARRM